MMSVMCSVSVQCSVLIREWGLSMQEQELKEVVAKLRETDTATIEVKSTQGGLPRDLAASIVAFANTRGGTVILGLDENSGFSAHQKFPAQRIRDAFDNMCSQTIVPAIRPTFLDIIPFEESSVVVASIPEADEQNKPVYLKNKGKYQGSYVRVADGDHKLERYEIDRLIEQSHQPTWDQEIVAEATIADLDQDILQQLLERERTLHPRLFGKADDATALQRLNIAKKDSQDVLRPTLAGLLSCGEYPQQFFPQLSVVFTHYTGDRKSSDHRGIRYLDSYSAEGPIPVMLEETIQKVQSVSARGGIIHGNRRYDLFDFPPVAVREAVANALLHRDYSPEARGTQVQVNVYTDRMEVINPGGLYGAVTLRTLGTSGISSSRNEALARILASTPYPGGGFVVENRGSGYQEIVDTLHRELFPPPIPRGSLERFSLEFLQRNATKAENQAKTGRTARSAIISYLQEHPSASSRDLAAASGYSLGTVRRTLTELLQEELVERTEPARSPKQRYRWLA